MPLHLALLLILAQSGDGLGDTKVFREYDFSVRPPAAWKAVLLLPPAFVRFEAPEGGPVGAQVVLRQYEPQFPMTLKVFFDEIVSPHFKGELADLKITTDENLTVSGHPCRLVVAQGKKKDGAAHAIVTAIAARGYKEFFFVDGACAGKDVDTLIALIRKVVGSLTLGLPDSKEEADCIAKLPALGFRAEVTGDRWYRVTVKGQKFGHQHVVIREGKLNGRPAYEWDVDQALKYSDGGTSIRSRGAFTPDGLSQKCDYEFVVEQKDQPKKTYLETVEIANGEATVTRTIAGVTELKKVLRLSEKTYLTDAADVVRGLAALAGKGTWGLRVLNPFSDVAQIEEIECGPMERIKIEDESVDGAVMLVKVARRRQTAYYVDSQGALLSVGAANHAFRVYRCTKDEALK